jgi:hypothetical protein
MGLQPRQTFTIGKVQNGRHIPVAFSWRWQRFIFKPVDQPPSGPRSNGWRCKILHSSIRRMLACGMWSRILSL